MRKALIQESDGQVLNLIEIDFPNNWPQPEGTYCVDAEGANIGDTWDGKKFIRPERPEPPPERDILAELDELKDKVDKLGDKK